MKIRVTLKQSDADGVGGQLLAKMGCDRVAPTVFTVIPIPTLMLRPDSFPNDIRNVLADYGVKPVMVEVITKVGTPITAGNSRRLPNGERSVVVSATKTGELLALLSDMATFVSKAQEAVHATDSKAAESMISRLEVCLNTIHNEELLSEIQADDAQVKKYQEDLDRMDTVQEDLAPGAASAPPPSPVSEDDDFAFDVL